MTSCMVILEWYQAYVNCNDYISVKNYPNEPEVLGNAFWV